MSDIRTKILTNGDAEELQNEINKFITERQHILGFEVTDIKLTHTFNFNEGMQPSIYEMWTAMIIYT